MEKKIKAKKYGTLQYLATWQGLRDDNLDIHMDKEVEFVCSKTGMPVIFTADTKNMQKNKLEAGVISGRG